MSKNMLLIIGSTWKDGHPSTYGGTAILMKMFVDYFNSIDFPSKFIPSNRYIGKNKRVYNFFYVLIKAMLYIPKARVVMVNGADSSTFILAPILYLVTKVCRKKFVFRKFGGSFDQMYSDASSFKKILVKNTIFNSDLILVESKHLVEFFKSLGCSKVAWFPNSRKKPVQTRGKRAYQKRFVFISHVKESKGIFEIIEAAKSLPANYTIDVYGPFTDESCSVASFKDSRVNYRGVIDPDSVTSTICSYDVLLLPTYHPGEGYPGIVIESLSVGVPVIATKWQALPEIVEDKVSGILIDIKSTTDLVQAIRYFNDKNYSILSLEAQKRFNLFDHENVNAKVFELIKGV